MIWADFNSRTEDDRVSLETRGSRESLAKTPVSPGEWVWLSDGDIRVGAQVEQRDGHLYARPVWETMEDVVPPGDPRLNEIPAEEALKALEKSRTREGFPADVVFRLAPYLPRKHGYLDFLRSRAARSLGYTALALAAIEDALTAVPSDGSYFHHRVRLLRDLDIEKAVQAIEPVLKGQRSDVLAIVACVEVLGDLARTETDEARSISHDSDILRVTSALTPASFAGLPNSVRAQVHLARGFAYSHLGNRPEARRELDEARALNPREPALLIARALEVYPSDQAAEDFHAALQFSSSFYWPGYFLAHHYLQRGEYAKSQTMAESALAAHPPQSVGANLCEWLAIARAEQGAPADEVRELFARAARLAPNELRIRQNGKAYEEAQRAAGAPKPPAWAVSQDASPRPHEMYQRAA
jgi:tetratricopeptide (TPR) repeat protein